MFTTALVNGCFGGQSGGETSYGSKVDARPRTLCACMDEDKPAVRARITSSSKGCAELEVLQLLVAAPEGEYMPLEVGDVFGGTLTLACPGSAEVESGDEVVAFFMRGAQTSTECPEYRACSAERCGNADDAYSQSVDPECLEQATGNAAPDCPPTEKVDEAAVVAYDQCDTRCLEETRGVCATHELDEQLGGRVTVLELLDDEVHFHWASRDRYEPLADLQSPECRERHKALHDESPPSDTALDNTALPVRDGMDEPPLTCPLQHTP